MDIAPNKNLPLRDDVNSCIDVSHVTSDDNEMITSSRKEMVQA